MAEALNRLTWVDELRGVDPDQAQALGPAIIECDIDCVTVDNSKHAD